MPKITWECEQCGKQHEGTMRPPEGWLEISFWNGIRFVRHSFCSYQCAGNWSLKRYEAQPKEAQL